MTDTVNGVPWSVLIEVGTALAAFLIGWGALRNSTMQIQEDIKDHGGRMVANEKQIEITRAEVAAYKTFVAETYIRSSDLDKMEDRIGKRLDTVEHVVRNTMTKVISAVMGQRGDQP